MAGERATKFVGIWCGIHLLLGLTIPLCARAQTTGSPPGPHAEKSDALTYLEKVFEKYGQAKTYHLEAVEEHEISAEFNRTWNKSITTAIVAPNNHYRFEKKAEELWVIQISDGKTEWVYQPELRQYTQQAAPSPGPNHPKISRARWAYELMRTQDMVKHLAGIQKQILTAEYLPDENVDVGGKTVACHVIRATRKELPGVTPGITMQSTFWIDTGVDLIRKEREQEEGPLRPSHPEDHHVSDRTTLFTVAEVEPTSLPDSLFEFSPPSNTAIVKDFDRDPIMARVHEFTGKQAPAVELVAADGKRVTLQSFAGKPVLLDFWATWCAPCVESLPSLEKLYQETADKGLVVLSIDEDEEANRASEFWTKHKEPWPNFHDGGGVAKQFPDHGIPYFVLVDSSGKVIFSDSGLDETKLRAALATLGPAFAALAKTPTP